MKVISAQPFSIGLLLQRLAENCNLGAQRMRQLDAHVPQAAHADDRYFLAGARLPLPKRRIQRDSRAQKGSAGIERQIIRHAQYIVFIDHDPVRISTIGWSALLIPRVVCPDGLHAAILLEASLALSTGAAGIDKTAHSHLVADLVLRHLAAHCGNYAGDFMPRHHGEDRFFLVVAPLVARLVNIGMTDSAILDLDDNIMFPRFAPIKRIRSKRSLGFQRRVAFTLAHDCSLSGNVVSVM